MFQYIENHNSLMANPVSRLGVQRKRPPVNRLFFPDAHINQSHLDGRILVGALVDLKKLISEGSIQKTNCAAPCDLSFSFPTVNQDIAFDAVNSLAFEAYSDLVSSSTLRAYAGLLLAAVSGNTHMQSVCNGNASCMSELESDFEEILLSRGLIQDNSYNIISDGDTIEASANVATELGWLPFLGSSRADDDDKIEPCELIVVFPQFSNQSESNGTKMSFYNIEAKLFDVDGFKNVFNFSTGSLVDIIFDDLSTVEDERRSKVLGWMEPEDNNLSLMRVPSTSIWYRNFETATLMRPLSTTVNPHGGGWMVEAPETKGETATIDFIVKVQAFSGNSTAEGSAVKTFAISQSLTVADTSVTNFCP